MLGIFRRVDLFMHLGGDTFSAKKLTISVETLASLKKDTQGDIYSRTDIYLYIFTYIYLTLGYTSIQLLLLLQLT